MEILKQSIRKLKKIPDAERCLRQAVLIRNTYNTAKQLTNDQIKHHITEENNEKENIIKSLCNDDMQSSDDALEELFNADLDKTEETSSL